MKKNITAFLIVTAISGFASARAAVSYNCSGYEPNLSGKGGLTKQAVVFNLVSAQDETTVQIVSKSRESVDPANSTLVVESGHCTFDMIPDSEFPAYRISISGTCGTKMNHNYKGICFFE
ncbi:hypothetical protein [Bdellovibrio sp. HCB337]|uniref:hypothetical protein n=1 Tax=Bdellovibrio sp. HCB337 TaxID=3394358 RepID=UPI0039A50B87